jgi:hypothetical protein
MGILSFYFFIFFFKKNKRRHEANTDKTAITQLIGSSLLARSRVQTMSPFWPGYETASLHRVISWPQLFPQGNGHSNTST